MVTSSAHLVKRAFAGPWSRSRHGASAATALVLFLTTLSAGAGEPHSVATASDGTAPAAVLAGEIVVDRVDAPGDPVPTFRARAVVDAPPAVVWDLVSHCAGYATLMPRIISSQERKRIGDLVECEVTVELPFPLPNLTSVTTATHREGSTKGRYSRTWTLVSGDYEVNEGAWIIEPVDGGKRSLATYRVRAKPNLPVPASLASLFQQGPLVESMRAVRRAASQHPRPSSADGTSPRNPPP